MSTEQKVVYIEKARPDKNKAHRSFSIFKVIHKLVIDKVNLSINQVFESIDDSLFSLAEKACSSTDHHNYFASMRDVRSKKKESINKYCQLITQANQSFLADENKKDDANQQQSDPEDDLTLLEHNQLEQTLAIENIISKVNLRSSKELSAIEARLGDLFPAKYIDEDSNPLSPKNLISLFFSACNNFEVDEQSQLVIYKQFDKVMANEFKTLYSRVNDLLIKNNVLPDLKGISKKPKGEGEEKEEEQKQQTVNNSPNEKLSGNDADLINVLYELLAQRRGEQVTQDFSESSQQQTENKVQIKDFINSLSHIQTERFHSQHNGIESPESIKSYISNKTGSVGQSPYSQIQSDTIDIVSMLFEFILGDSNIPNNIKALIGRLQIPVLKVAVIDSTFFNRPNHPARALINELAGTAIGVQSSSLASQDQLLQKTEAIVNKILTEFNDDVTIFEDLLNDLREFQKIEQQRADAIEKKTRDAEESKVKVENSKALVRNEIEKRVQGKEIPESVLHMLSDAWSKYLFITHLKNGEESDLWQSGLQTIDNLVWSLSPKDNDGDKTKLLAMIPKVQRELREGLNSILFNPFEITKIFQNLEKFHISTLTTTNDLVAANSKGEDDDFIDPQPSPATEQNNIKDKLHSLRLEMQQKKNIQQHKIDETNIPPNTAAETKQELIEESTTKEDLTEAETSSAKEDENIAQQELLSKIDQIEIGTWFEFTQDNSEKIRAKLSARLRNGERLIFVNRSGFKMAEKSSEQLADEINLGITEILNDSLLFDRALESVISDLKQIKSDREKIHHLY